mmetsp:Transcript_28216/g.81319  ORF Transcript_28216/g.81319 Transcript_28216/m.81319 type:complete len:299 (-) Transcript_28216:257-1153(-)
MKGPKATKSATDIENKADTQKAIDAARPGQGRPVWMRMRKRIEPHTRHQKRTNTGTHPPHPILPYHSVSRLTCSQSPLTAEVPVAAEQGDALNHGQHRAGPHSRRHDEDDIGLPAVPHRHVVHQPHAAVGGQGGHGSEEEGGGDDDSVDQQVLEGGRRGREDDARGRRRDRHHGVDLHEDEEGREDQPAADAEQPRTDAGDKRDAGEEPTPLLSPLGVEASQQLESEAPLNHGAQQQPQHDEQAGDDSVVALVVVQHRPAGDDREKHHQEDADVLVHLEPGGRRMDCLQRGHRARQGY